MKPLAASHFDFGFLDFRFAHLLLLLGLWTVNLLRLGIGNWVWSPNRTSFVMRYSFVLVSVHDVDHCCVCMRMYF